ncbi:MAG: nitroreductase family protein [Defluviitaleaceae bacterium]|nr:nitroreductase family protein [Defluviitaleaceae bacterium]
MSTPVLQAIFERNSCRDFTGEPLTKTEVDLLAKAALAAPSAVNRQPWHIIMCNDKALMDELESVAMEVVSADEDKGTYNRIMERGGKMFYNAPAMALICGDSSDWAVLDSGILVENLALAAHSLGLGNVICGMMRIPLNSPKADHFAQRLKIPAGYKFTIAILIGKANTGKEPHELDMTKVTFV